jgi:3-oxoacyl-(acyl-carrier-protein) synthase
VGRALKPYATGTKQRVAQPATGDGFPDVVVTGIAMTTALATDPDSTWKKLLDKQSGIRKLDDPFVDEFDLPVRIGGHLLEDFDYEMTRLELRRFLRLQKMSTVVGRRVWVDAGSPEVDTNRLMVSIGTVLGEADIAICGGVETRSRPSPSPRLLSCICSMNNDDPAGECRPFDKDRDVLVFAEAGALMVIETEDHAKARNANIFGRLMGAGITSDGHHMVAPDPNGERAGHAITRAIELAGLAPGDIDHVNAHAAGTAVGDLAEAKAINNTLGVHRPAVYAPKAALGYSIGAIGAVESILTVLALRDGIIPPTVNLRNVDPQVDLDVVADEPRAGDNRYAINNSFGFGGHNVALAFGSY